MPDQNDSIKDLMDVKTAASEKVVADLADPTPAIENLPLPTTATLGAPDALAEEIKNLDETIESAKELQKIADKIAATPELPIADKYLEVPPLTEIKYVTPEIKYTELDAKAVAEVLTREPIASTNEDAEPITTTSDLARSIFRKLTEEDLPKPTVVQTEEPYVSPEQKQAILEKNHKDNCPMGQLCDHFDPERGIPAVYRKKKKFITNE